jgi:hypothetical protein
MSSAVLPPQPAATRLLLPLDLSSLMVARLSGAGLRFSQISHALHQDRGQSNR